jgi:hypothetical protein
MKKPVNIYVSNPYFETRVLFTLITLYRTSQVPGVLDLGLLHPVALVYNEK